MTLSYDAFLVGDGPVLVLLHSSVCDRRMWEPQWQPLIDAGFRVVRCDFRGFGDTPAAERPHTHAGDVLELLDVLGIDTAALVGSSYGGRVALEIAASSPERVDSLALLCAAPPEQPGSSGEDPSAELLAFATQEEALLDRGDIAAAVELNVDTWLGPEAGSAARGAVRQMQHRAFDVQLGAGEEFDGGYGPVELSAVTARCLAVSGRHDFVDFRTAARGLPDRIAGAIHRELDWAGHFPGLERPAEVTALLIAFLGTVRPV
ncbi:alpha/beta fold hydrolase [Streptacidiphilus albus]|uniref:alpha/beta fold hydrolase n=1 Tax=Streptacidiphilus albus TaxID=105425 RepID=UPI00054BD749|nr:alpha/beta hydrolase [Streptacidiphilus albus]